MKPKPCPFCKSIDLELQSSTEDREGIPVNIICTSCGACGPWYYEPDKDLLNGKDAIEIVAKISGWNERKGE